MQYTDSDSEEELTNIPNYAEQNESQRVKGFRQALSSWKKTQLDSIIGDKQDNVILNKYSKNSSDLYYALKKHIEEGAPLNVNDTILTNALGGNIKNLSMDERIRILQSLFRDLIEFRFTYDTNLIDDFKNDEKLDTNIVPN